MKKVKVKNRAQSIRTKMAVVMFSMTAFLFAVTPTYAAPAISAKVAGASNGFVALLQSMGKPVVMAVIAIIGIGLLIATQRQKESIKDGILPKLIGVALLILAVPAADAIWGIF